MNIKTKVMEGPLGKHEIENVCKAEITLGDVYKYPEQVRIALRGTEGFLVIEPLENETGYRVSIDTSNYMMQATSGNVFNIYVPERGTE